MEQRIRHGVVGHEDVRVAVAVVVGNGDAHAFTGRGGDAAQLGDILKMAAAEVPVQGIGGGGKLGRIAIDHEAARRIVTDGARRAGPLDIVDDEEVEAAIAIIIEPTGGNGPRSAMDSGLLSYLLKVLACDIAIEMAAAGSGDEQVYKTVVVEIGGSGAD